MKLSLLVIRCKDIDRSKSFYESIGLKFKKEKHGNGPEHYSTDNDGIVFELYPNKGLAPTDNTRFGFKLENLIEVVKHLEIDNTYEFNSNTIYVVKDPDGRKIELS